MYNLDQFNLLDLDNDVLNIIGDYVKKDNKTRNETKGKEKRNLFLKVLIIIYNFN